MNVVPLTALVDSVVCLLNHCTLIVPPEAQSAAPEPVFIY